MLRNYLNLQQTKFRCLFYACEFCFKVMVDQNFHHILGDKRSITIIFIRSKQLLKH